MTSLAPRPPLRTYVRTNRTYGHLAAFNIQKTSRRLRLTRNVTMKRKRVEPRVMTTGSPLVIGVEDTEDSKPKDGRR